MAQEKSIPTPHLIGVRGWLLLLCFVLTIGYPLSNLILMIKTYIETSQIFRHFPSFATALAVEYTIKGLNTAYSIYTGILLWKRRPGAVGNAKRFILLQPVVVCLTYIPYALAHLPAPVVEALAAETAKMLSWGIVWSGAWWFYLRKSQRVRNTFPHDFLAKR